VRLRGNAQPLKKIRDFEPRALRGGDRLAESSKSHEGSRDGGRGAAIVRAARHPVVAKNSIDINELIREYSFRIGATVRSKAAGTFEMFTTRGWVDMRDDNGLRDLRYA
jgi:hypothetical protein